MNKMVKGGIFTSVGRHLEKLSSGLKLKPKWNVVTAVGEVSQMLEVPKTLEKPPYWKTGVPPPSPETPELKTAEQLRNLRSSCSLAFSILQHLESFVKVDMTTDEIDREVHRMCLENDAYPSPLNYSGFPKSCCTSVNNIACHGIPDSRKLQDGDIINIDITVYKNGMHGDCSRMYKIGYVDDGGSKLCDVTYEAVERAVHICGPGVPYYKIGEEIEKFVESKGLTVIPCFIGHGIGSYFHGPPDIYHHKFEEAKLLGNMTPGVAFTIEPAVGEGKKDIVILEDGWTACTLDDSRAAQSELTVFINSQGVEVLTK
ncbi:methionine aminopeptidase 1D, mitochondrial [Cimex lectularius]|uniref:Methionine aminopeptidase n=1 Tax=Cimex lectularius TaxID=79782 RepID=A0A8I6TBG1_CIMLE|nr:methionine aminopeptidase 1D, mitochondrial [Cimex lectularius]